MSSETCHKCNYGYGFIPKETALTTQDTLVDLLPDLETTIVVVHLRVPQTTISAASTTITHVTDSTITASITAN